MPIGGSHAKVPRSSSLQTSLHEQQSLHKQMRDAGYLPVLQDAPSLDRRIVSAREDSAPSLRHTRCSVISLLGMEILRCIMWFYGVHPEGDIWIIHRVGMLTDFFVLFISLPLAYLGVEKLVVRSGVMGMSMCWIASMLLVDMMALFLLALYILPLLALQVGSPMFWHALTTLFDIWACMLIISNFMQAVVGVSVWRIYREMRVQRLYPANAKDAITHADVFKAEVFCEPEDVIKCNDGCQHYQTEFGCVDAPESVQMFSVGERVAALPIPSNQSDHQKYRVPYPTGGQGAQRTNSRNLFADEGPENNETKSTRGFAKLGAEPLSAESTQGWCGSVHSRSRDREGYQNFGQDTGMVQVALEETISLHGAMVMSAPRAVEKVTV